MEPSAREIDAAERTRLRLRVLDQGTEPLQEVLGAEWEAFQHGLGALRASGEPTAHALSGYLDEYPEARAWLSAALRDPEAGRLVKIPAMPDAGSREERVDLVAQHTSGTMLRSGQEAGGTPPPEPPASPAIAPLPEKG